MDIIKYNIIYTPVNNRLTKKEHVYVYDTIDKFLEYDPPCKECLVQVTCIQKLKFSFVPYLFIKMCDELKVFVINNDGFNLN